MTWCPTTPREQSPLVITGEVITLEEMGPNNNKAQKFNAQTSSLRAHDRDASLDPRSLARFILGTGTDGTSGGSCFSLFTVHTVILGKVAPAAIGFYRSMADSYIAVVRAKLGETPRVGSRRSDKPRSDTPSPRARTYVATTGKATVTGPAFSPITNSRSRDSALLTRGLINPACSGVIRPISRVEELGSAAPGRRVNLPWHPSRLGFKLATGDGTLIRQ